MEKVILKPRVVKYYNFSQNNSGGYFYTNDDYGISEEVIVAAGSPEEAVERLSGIGDKIGSDFYSYCSCCGERWSLYSEFLDGTKSPEIYGEKLSECTAGSFRNVVYVHEDDLSFTKHELSAK